jgi:hypothetical protein
LNVLDDHSRLCVAPRAFRTTKAPDLVETSHQAAVAHGLPAEMLTGTTAIFVAESRRGPLPARDRALRLGIDLNPRQMNGARSHRIRDLRPVAIHEHAVSDALGPREGAVATEGFAGVLLLTTVMRAKSLAAA